MKTEKGWMSGRDVREFRTGIPKKDFGYVLRYLPVHRKGLIGSHYYKKGADTELETYDERKDPLKVIAFENKNVKGKVQAVNWFQEKI